MSPQLLKAFHQGLQELGYVEGRNIVIEYRFGEGKSDRYPDLAAELVQLRVDVIVTASTPAVEVVKNATSRISIITAASGDPVESGLVASIRPSGCVKSAFIFRVRLLYGLQAPNGSCSALATRQDRKRHPRDIPHNSGGHRGDI